jgi:hypothetical protein
VRNEVAEQMDKRFSGKLLGAVSSYLLILLAPSFCFRLLRGNRVYLG